jgi:hypothetical protein
MEDEVYPSEKTWDFRECLEWRILPCDLEDMIQRYAWGKLIFVSEWSHKEEFKENVHAINPILRKYSYEGMVETLTTLATMDHAVMKWSFNKWSLNKTSFVLRAEFEYKEHNTVRILFEGGDCWTPANSHTVHMYLYLDELIDKELTNGLVNRIVCAFGKRLVTCPTGLERYSETSP